MRGSFAIYVLIIHISIFDLKLIYFLHCPAVNIKKSCASSVLCGSDGILLYVYFFKLKTLCIGYIFYSNNCVPVPRYSCLMNKYSYIYNLPIWEYEYKYEISPTIETIFGLDHLYSSFYWFSNWIRMTGQNINWDLGVWKYPLTHILPAK